MIRVIGNEIDHCHPLLGMSLPVAPICPKGARRPDPLAVVLEIPEVMYILRIGRTRAYSIIERHQLRHYKEGKSIRVPIDAIKEYQQAKMVRSSSN
jgi:hypothetical protein